ncbi:hypothetical protein [Chryseobacterium oryctis]|uniref:Uncharacterized protein n=1 Tax=Chryseobacterium oryctis TaxID=2952618 RepID=A0ABT3HSV4_9FLAO|nr:hypothetical protein [Chryseobacterium oryctis]MCW3162863.1 hypothetical protein [Chryseobacterium oryctis]
MASAVATPSGINAKFIIVAVTRCPEVVLFFPPKSLLKKFVRICPNLIPVLFLGVGSLLPPTTTPAQLFPRARTSFFFA